MHAKIKQEYVILNRWLKESPSPLPPNASHQVTVCLKHRFNPSLFLTHPRFLHRYSKVNDYNFLYAESRQVGIGAFVTNERGEVLMVQEGSGPLLGSGVWKMPTGLVAAGEDLHEAAPREVFEETVKELLCWALILFLCCDVPK